MKDNKDVSSTFVTSHLLQHFTKNSFQTSQRFPIHSHHSANKIEPARYSKNISVPNQNRQLTNQNSRKKLLALEKQYEQHFQQIQKILMNQNDNLKQQNQYLASEIRRITKKQKHIKQQLEEITCRSQQQQNYIVKLQADFAELKEFTLITLIQTKSLTQIKNSLLDFIESASNLLNIENVQKQRRLSANQKSAQERSADQSIQKQIQELKFRLQTLIEENNSLGKQPSVRRECIEIAKQIKQLQNQQKTPNIYKHQHQIFYDQHTHNTVKNGTRSSYNLQKTSRLSLKQQSLIKKEQNEDNFKYPKQIYNKVTHRRSGNKLEHTSSVGSMLSPREHR